MSSDESVLARPIVILGAPRSGTTLMGRLLCLHPDLCYLVEPRLIWKYGNDARSDLLEADHATKKVRQGVRRKFAKAIRASGKTRLLEKTPSNSLRPGFVDAIFPDCLFVHIIRHGVDSVLSIESFWQEKAHGLRTVVPGRAVQRIGELEWWRFPYYVPEYVRRVAPSWMHWLTGKNEWGPRLPGLRQMAAELSAVELAALQWRYCVELSCQFGRTLPADRYMEIRLDALSVDVIRDVIGFCDLSPSAAIEDMLTERFDPTRPRGRSREIDPEKRERILRWIRPTLHWLGLEDDAATAPDAALVHAS